MSEQKVQQLLQLAVKSVKEGDKAKGRQAFLAALKLEPNNESAWLGLATVTDNNLERLGALKKVLQLNRDNERALALLDRLGLTVERLLGEPEPPEPVAPPPALSSMFEDTPAVSAFSEDALQDVPVDPFSEEEIEIAPPEPAPPPRRAGSAFELPPPMLGSEVGVPVPDPQKLGNITREVEQLVTDYLASDYEFDYLEWTRKTKRRAGESAIWRWRLQLLGMFVIAVLLFVVLPIFAFLSTPEGQKAIFAPTHTRTSTPTFTPSHTPGITPTPSPEPLATYTLTPEFDVLGRQGSRFEQPAATDMYSPDSVPVNAGIRQAWELIESGEYVRAFEILEDEKDSRAAGYPWPYYLQARIDILNDNPDEAQRKLEEGEALAQTLASDQREPFDPMYNLAYAEVALYRAIRAREEGRVQDSNSAFNEAESRFQTAIDLDGTLTLAYVGLAQLHVAKQEFDEAIEVLNIPILGDLQQEFFDDILLRVEKGRVYMAQGDYDQALQQANEALYFQPYAEEAYILQAEAALAQNRPDLANNYLDGYQLFYPGSLLAFKLEGDAYLQENKLDQALIAYNRALTGNEDDPTYVIALEALGDLYYGQRRFDLAQERYDELLQRENRPEIRAKRMIAAYNSGDYQTAQRDAERLEDTNVVSNGDLALLQGQILADTARNQADWEDALNQIVQAVVQIGVSPESRAIADEYIARANYELGNYSDALSSINRAISVGETGTRHYLKALILEAEEDYVEAREEYEFLLAWSEIFPYPFIDDVQERYAKVVDLIENPPEDDA